MGNARRSDTVFDTHEIARSLTAADLTDAQADAITAAVRRAVEHDAAAAVDVDALATKADVAAVQADVVALEERMTHFATKEDIAALEARMTHFATKADVAALDRAHGHQDDRRAGRPRGAPGVAARRCRGRHRRDSGRGSVRPPAPGRDRLVKIEVDPRVALMLQQ